MTRPLLHLTPTTGWMNDPNGLTQVDGVHHLFFQHNPDAPTFGVMRWGHATSTDLVHWTEHPTALTSRPGAADAGGCWSGCAVRLADGRTAVLYTGVQPPELGGPQRAAAVRAVASDASLVAWQVDDEPVIADWPTLDPPLTDWRDHAVLPLGGDGGDGDGGQGLLQVVAAGTAGHDGAGRLLAYTSSDPELRAWTYDGVFLDAAAAGLDAHVFECPDVFTADGGELVVVLSWYSKDADAELHHSSGALWLTGRLEQDDDGGARRAGAARFVPQRRGVLDLGSRFYAPQSYTAQDGRRIAFGWLRTQDDPAIVGRSSVGAQSLPRRWSVVGRRLHQTPTAEITDLAGDVVVGELPQPVRALVVRLEVDGGASLVEGSLVLVGPDGHRTSVDLAVFARSTTDVLVDGTWTPEASQVEWAEVYVDTGIVEVFTSDGRAAASSDLALTAVAAVEVTGPVRASVRLLTP
ncbi:beta-fructofuranosidase [Quadrisphaera granulorum]|uniref:beta-fructofuranosidase n=1 Tax=Quadrisphaera granulorum TaxID=317664 RepID=A0A316ABA1_9ACTN|nr:glycoside hydrolase family 32 protein [Quadrisphaera granulorum]PWJ54134.1 beta-fructofuranosidase [Quadrisphaera granulorum]SZE96273.1 beta-fructofuranosidase [Quadrisphaera granulorum]